jgi:hypothetical protein
LDPEHFIYHKERKGSNYHLDKNNTNSHQTLKKLKIVTKDVIYIVLSIKQGINFIHAEFQVTGS